MAQLERPERQVESPKSHPTIHTMEQLLRGESYKSKQSPTYSSSSSTNSSSSPFSSSSSPFFQRFRHHDSEEEHGQNQKKSVLTKVKEKAKKLRHSLSKRKHEDGSASSPSSATGVEGDGVEEDAEYLGAPMYESEKAPAGYKANTRQHSSPRANPVTLPEKHVISNSDKHVVEPDQDKTLNRSISKKLTTTTTKPGTSTTSPNATTSTNNNINTNTFYAPIKTMTETVAQKSKPVHAEKPGAADITSKIQDLNVSKPSEHHDQTSSSSAAAVAPKTTRSTSLSNAAQRTSPAKVPSQAPASVPRTTSAPVPSATPPSGKNPSPTAQIWDKGVSMKEYLLNKLEPGEDEKALSQVISEAMSPKRTPGDAGVMEKVREAVTSLLRNEGPTKYADTNTTATATATSQSPASINMSRTSSQMPASTNTSRASSQMSPSTNTYSASSQIPLSSNAQQDNAVAREENHGRTLQAN